MAVADSIGLDTRLPDDRDGGDVDEGQVAEQFFAVSFELDDVDMGPHANLLYNHPLCSAVLMRPADFDGEAKPILCVRVSGAGANVFISKPIRESAEIVTMTIMRRNQRDFLLQLSTQENPTQEERAATKGSFETLLHKTCGSHTAYATLNNAYNQLFAEMERWTVRLRVFAPYMFDSLNRSIFTRRPGAAADAMIVFPLVETIDAPLEVPIEFQVQ